MDDVKRQPASLQGTFQCLKVIAGDLVALFDSGKRMWSSTGPASSALRAPCSGESLRRKPGLCRKAAAAGISKSAPSLPHRRKHIRHTHCMGPRPCPSRLAVSARATQASTSCTSKGIHFFQAPLAWLMDAGSLSDAGPDPPVPAPPWIPRWAPPVAPHKDRAGLWLPESSRRRRK